MKCLCVYVCACSRASLCVLSVYVLCTHIAMLINEKLAYVDTVLHFSLKGCFGTVYSGTLTTAGDEELKVAVKTLKGCYLLSVECRVDGCIGQ